MSCLYLHYIQCAEDTGKALTKAFGEPAEASMEYWKRVADKNCPLSEDKKVNYLNTFYTR